MDLEYLKRKFIGKYYSDSSVHMLASSSFVVVPCEALREVC